VLSPLLNRNGYLALSGQLDNPFRHLGSGCTVTPVYYLNGLSNPPQSSKLTRRTSLVSILRQPILRAASFPFLKNSRPRWPWPRSVEPGSASCTERRGGATPCAAAWDGRN